MKSISNKTKIISAVLALVMIVALVGGLVTVTQNVDIAMAASHNVFYTSPDVKENTVGEVNNIEKPFGISQLLTYSGSLIKPGDTIKVLPGVYDITTTLALRFSGSYDNYVTIENASDSEQAVLSFYRQSFNGSNRGAVMYGDYIRWRDIDICGAGDNGMLITGSYNIIEDCEFYDNRDTGLQLARAESEMTNIKDWPHYNLVRNCTSHNNYDNETYGENADGFAAKLTVGYGNVFDNCISYRNSDDGWDLYAKVDSGNIGSVIMYNCVAFENGFLEYSQAECNAKFPEYHTYKDEENTASYTTRDGDGNGFKLGGSILEGDVILVNCMSFNNKLHGVTDNSNPGVISVTGVTSFDNGRDVDVNGYPSATQGYEGANIDVSRQTYSYNVLDSVLSMQSQSAMDGLDSDAYRASVTDSILGAGDGKTTLRKFDGSLDADSKNEIDGVSISAPAASAVFKAIPIDYANGVYNLTGRRDMEHPETRMHIRLRNPDGSVNMGDILAIKDYSKLLGNNKKIGAVLNLTSYDAYSHFDLTNDYSSVHSAEEATVKAAKESLVLTPNPKAVYQDFWVPVNMEGVEISWESSNPEIFEVTDQLKTSISRANSVYVVVKRDVASDVSVTLTATITSIEDSSVSATKQFQYNVKMDEPRIGDIYAIDPDGKRVPDGESIIMDQFFIATEPPIIVVNGANYSGAQFVAGSQYTLQTKYEYATNKNSTFIQVKGFTPSNAGVWRITHTVTLILSKETKTFTYYIYTASPEASLDFAADERDPITLATISHKDFTVNLEGFIIAGDLSNVTGTLYAVASPTELNVTAANIKDQPGVQSRDFRAHSISFQFQNPNDQGYHVYYAIANVRGEVTSPVYHEQVSVVQIKSTSEFMKLAGGKTIGKEDISKTIYLLTKCLDFKNVTWKASTDAFTGLLNGQGHKISNIKVTGTSLFSKIEGGTIANLRIDNVIITSSSDKAGIVSSAYGGYFHNLELTRIRVDCKGQRAAGLIAQVYDGKTPTQITNVKLVNPMPQLDKSGNIVEQDGVQAYYISANSNRAAGLIGLIQPRSDATNDVKVTVKNCFVESYIVSGAHTIGSMVAELDDQKASAGLIDISLTVENCYTTSVLVSTSSSSSRIGGILGYHRGGGSMRIAGCYSRIEMYFAGAYLESSVKNASGIVGNFSSLGGLVINCVSTYDEYNTNFSVGVQTDQVFINDYNLAKAIIESTMRFDMSIWQYVMNPDKENKLMAPFIQLPSINTCSCS